MSEDIAISVENVSKAYRIWESPSARLMSPLQGALANCLPKQNRLSQWLELRSTSVYRDFYALRDISFSVKRGEGVGIIGRNGSGKSTLLQIIARTLQPTSGSLQVRGRVAALLELGSGFNPEFTGHDNVFLNAAILGLSKVETEARFDGIAAFADIGDFLDQPVKTYSSGMIMRLAFAVQTAVEPDILIVDEALSVGDFFFSQKCMRRMQELRATGTTLLFVSHDMASVRDITSRSLLLNRGEAQFFGETQRALSLYFQAEPLAQPTPPAPIHTRPASQAIRASVEAFLATALWQAAPSHDRPTDPAIIGLAVQDERDQALLSVILGQPARIFLLVETKTAATFNAAIEIKNRYDQVVCSLSTHGCGLPEINLAGAGYVQIEFNLVFNFEAGLYTLCGVIGQTTPFPNRGNRVNTTPWVGPLKIEWDYENHSAPFLGMFGPPVKVSTQVLTQSDH